MAFIQLITDFQTGAYKIGILKQNLLNSIESVEIIDISHDIRLNNITEAAFVAKQLNKTVKTLTINYIKVGFANRLIIYQQDLQWYVVPDNGLIALIFEINDLSNLYSLNSNDELEAFKAIINGEKISASGTIILRNSKKPEIQENRIICERIFTDKLGNCYFNLLKSEFDSVFKPNQFGARIQYINITAIGKISSKITDEEQGKASLSFSKSGFLKLAINNGNAAQLFRIKEDSKIIIDKI